MKTKHKEPKIICWDIETSLVIATTFSLYPDSLSHEGILQDWFIICGAWKELGKDKVHTVQIKKNTDDYQVCKTLRDALADADIIVHHNGDKFDIKKLNARLMFHKLPPLPLIPTVDTLKEVKKVAQFTSHRLDYLGKHLFGQGKLKHSSGMWIDIAKGDLKPVKEMVAYNEIDVVRLEQLYLYLRPYMKSHPHMGILKNDDKHSCIKCGSSNMLKDGIRMTAGGIKKQRNKCGDCGSYTTTAISKTNDN